MISNNILIYSYFSFLLTFTLVTKAQSLQSNSLEGNDQLVLADIKENAHILINDDVADDNEIQSQIQSNNINNMLFGKNQAIKSSNTKWMTKPRIESKLTNQKFDSKIIESKVNFQDPNNLPELNKIFVGDSITKSVVKEPIVLSSDFNFGNSSEELSILEKNSTSNVRTATLASTLRFSSNNYVKENFKSTSATSAEIIHTNKPMYDDEEFLIDNIYYEEELQQSIENIAKKVMNDYLLSSLVTYHITSSENACSTKTIIQNITTTFNVTHTLTTSLYDSIASTNTTFTNSNVFSTFEEFAMEPIQLDSKIPLNLTEFNRSISKDVKDFDHVNTMNFKISQASSSKANLLPVNLEDLLSSSPAEPFEEIKDKKTGVSGWMHDVKSFFSRKPDGKKYKLSAANKKETFVNYFGKRSLILGEEDLNEYTNNDHTLQIYNRYNSMMGAVVAVLAVVLLV